MNHEEQNTFDAKTPPAIFHAGRNNVRPHELPPVRYLLAQMVAGNPQPFNPEFVLADGSYRVEPFTRIEEARAAKKRYLEHSDCNRDSIVIVKVRMEVVE